MYQASAVNLQANAYSSPHQRLLDGVACGALVISRFNPADFVREPFLRIQRIIANEGLTSLEDVIAKRGRDRALADACAEAEERSGVVIAIWSVRPLDHFARMIIQPGYFDLIVLTIFISALGPSCCPAAAR